MFSDNWRQRTAIGQSRARSTCQRPPFTRTPSASTTRRGSIAGLALRSLPSSTTCWLDRKINRTVDACARRGFQSSRMPGRKDPGRKEEANAMVKIDITTDVKRPVEEVYTYVADLRNAPQWQSWLQTVQQQGQTRKGIKVHQSGQWMGRKLEFDSEITEYEPGRKFSFTASSPFPYTLSNSFGQHDGGTRIESQ